MSSYPGLFLLDLLHCVRMHIITTTSIMVSVSPVIAPATIPMTRNVIFSVDTTVVIAVVVITVITVELAVLVAEPIVKLTESLFILLLKNMDSC